ncbi:MAG TPA: amidohydrolase family protein [Chitinophagales bacterium]|nr:amidohydrolase family protein [Chitinophagales bacterium]
MKQILSNILPFLFLLNNSTATLIAQNYAIQHGTIHVGNGQVIEDGVILFEKNKIINVGKFASEADKKYTRIDATGKQIYPGIILANTDVGLVEAEAIRPTRDDYEVNLINTNIRSLIAFNTDSKVLPTYIFNGITYAQVCPRGGLVAGSSSVMKTNGWNWEDAVELADDGIHLYYPSLINWGGKPNEKYTATYNKIETFLADAKAYADTFSLREKVLTLEPMREVFSGNKNLYIHVNGEKEIITAVLLAEKYGIKPVLVGAKDCEKIISFLKEKGCAIILHKMHILPLRVDDDVNAIYKIPNALAEAGILFCFGNNEYENWNARNIMFNAGSAVAFGLQKEEAIKALTYNPAKILKCENQMGTLEAGKNATFLISKGDILDMKSNQLETVFIDGQEVNLNENWQQQLYEKYLQKYKQENSLKP